MKNFPIREVKGIIIGAVLVVGATSVLAWTGPTSIPPNGNTPAPVNVGLNTQSKLGQLFVNTDLTNPYSVGLAVFGTSTFNGKTQIIDGTQGVGKVLASDVNGTAAWVSTSTLGLVGANPSSGGGTSCQVYDSGWFDVSTKAASTVTLTHGLNTTNLTFSIFASDSSNGANATYMAGTLAGASSDINLHVYKVTSSQLSVYLGSYYSTNNNTPGYWKYLRVLASQVGTGCGSASTTTTSGGPHFINPVPVHVRVAGGASYISRICSGSGGDVQDNSPEPWTTFNASPYIPAGATAVILSGNLSYGISGNGVITMAIRADSSSPAHSLVTALYYNNVLNLAAEQGVFPVASNGTFQWMIGPAGSANCGETIFLDGYFN